MDNWLICPPDNWHSRLKFIHLSDGQLTQPFQTVFMVSIYVSIRQFVLFYGVDLFRFICPADSKIKKKMDHRLRQMCRFSCPTDNCRANRRYFPGKWQIPCRFSCPTDGSNDVTFRVLPTNYPFVGRTIYLFIRQMTFTSVGPKVWAPGHNSRTWTRNHEHAIIRLRSMSNREHLLMNPRADEACPE